MSKSRACAHVASLKAACRRLAAQRERSYRAARVWQRTAEQLADLIDGSEPAESHEHSVLHATIGLLCEGLTNGEASELVDYGGWLDMTCVEAQHIRHKSRVQRLAWLRTPSAAKGGRA